MDYRDCNFITNFHYNGEEVLVPIIKTTMTVVLVPIIIITVTVVLVPIIIITVTVVLVPIIIITVTAELEQNIKTKNAELLKL